MQQTDARAAECVLLVRLSVRCDHSREFHEFEAHAERIMARYGGVIEVVSTSSAAARAAALPCFEEVHRVSFPDEASFEAYRRDAELAAFAPVRAQAIVKTEIERVEGARSVLERDVR